MKKQAIHIQSNVHDTIRIYVDQDNSATILNFLFSDTVMEEFKEMTHSIINRLRDKDRYCKTHLSEKAKNMFEMRFTRNQRNDRIYCQEASVNKRRHIVMIELYEGKKSQSIPQKIRGKIQTMGGYEYEY